ncbi:hypothetical protein QTH97_28985 [Variovorax sp. J22R24]|uniref:response regulator n=1 Tax=Variovorax gracilis TaxID=3053502 RepID=UPI002577784D|nr:response regulator [Variovorax sp. J22R24]MDM0109010.1 hypothetical protein [Variovorax sp. J22R24]
MTYPNPSVYLIEPDPDEKARLAAVLAGFTHAVVALDGARAFFAVRPVEEYACVLAALELPDMDILDFVASAGRILPVIVLGRTDELCVAVDIMRAGAVDFLERPSDARRLRAAVRGATKGLQPGEP